MKGRLFSQAFAVMALYAGHSIAVKKMAESQDRKKKVYENERNHICAQRGITIEEFEEERLKEHEQRHESNLATGGQIRQTHTGSYFTPEQRREIEEAIRAQSR